MSASPARISRRRTRVGSRAGRSTSTAASTSWPERPPRRKGRIDDDRPVRVGCEADRHRERGHGLPGRPPRHRSGVRLGPIDGTLRGGPPGTDGGQVMTARLNGITLKGRVAVVTGSTSGIGLGVARTLATYGAAVLLNGFGAKPAIEAAIADVAAHGTAVAYSAADMSKPGEIAAMLREAARDLGP